MSRLITKSWIVFVQAIILSFESIVVEFLTEIHGISSLLVAGIGIPLAGMTLLFISTVLSKKITVFKSWKLLLVASIFLAAAVFLWYDSVNRVGASKEGLLAGPLETIVVLILAWLLLKEKLRKIQLVGVIIALFGFFATVSSRSLSTILPLVITFGDLEAVLSAFAFAGGVIVMTKLVKRYTTIEVTGASLLISGLILAVLLILSTSQTSIPTVPEWIFLVSFSLLPLGGALLYVIGLDRIGASLTSTIASSNILFTLFLQLLFKGLGVKSNLPENILLALIGGALGLFGIYLVHMEKDYLIRKRNIGN
jgi:drug/metabolite transporter (DMT)-like permease